MTFLHLTYKQECLYQLTITCKLHVQSYMNLNLKNKNIILFKNKINYHLLDANQLLCTIIIQCNYNTVNNHRSLVYSLQTVFTIFSPLYLYTLPEDVCANSVSGQTYAHIGYTGNLSPMHSV